MWVVVVMVGVVVLVMMLLLPAGIELWRLLAEQRIVTFIDDHLDIVLGR